MSGEAIDQAVRITSGSAVLEGALRVPEHGAGLVIFAHGSGSSRFSRRNRAVARTLEASGLGTLLLDLLTPEEEAVDERTAQHRFDVALLGRRVRDAALWAERSLGSPALALFGASTGAAAALIAAAARPEIVHAVVSRGGRPDLAGEALPEVRAPTLLIVGGEDREVLELNRQAMRRMHATVQLEIVSRATHLFEEPGALEEVARLAADWCLHHFRERAALGVVPGAGLEPARRFRGEGF